MWTIRDYIVGEIIVRRYRQDAIKEAKTRVSRHNAEYNYGHRGKHYNANASYEIDENKKQITIRGG